ncbi:MAG: thymidine kinase [Zestosphaera sp.]
MAALGLYVITGPMFAGKTTELLRILNKYRIAGYRTLLVKPSIDKRYSLREVVSHDGIRMEALAIEPTLSDLLRVSEVLYSHDVIGFDEFQFFEYRRGLVDFILRLSDEKTVYVASLNLDFRGEPWEIVKELLPYADEIQTLYAVCTYVDPETGRKCGKPASRTQRLIDGKPAPYESPRILVGGKESYEARCRKHHFVVK